MADDDDDGSSLAFITPLTVRRLPLGSELARPQRSTENAGQENDGSSAIEPVIILRYSKHGNFVKKVAGNRFRLKR